MSQNEDANNPPPAAAGGSAANSNKYVPWPVRKGIFKSIGQNEFSIPNREPSPIVESPSSARSSPARFVPGFNRSMSPRITIEESPLSPPALVTDPPTVYVHSQSPPPPFVQSPPTVTLSNGPFSVHHASQPCSPVVREVPIRAASQPPSSGEVMRRSWTLNLKPLTQRSPRLTRGKVSLLKCARLMSDRKLGTLPEIIYVLSLSITERL